MKLQPSKASHYRTLIITDIKNETKDVKTFVLTPQGNTLYPYNAGQFITFIFSDIKGEERRSYSISGAPALQEPLQITVKRIENGKYSRPLVDNAKLGDELSVIEAAGQFTLPNDLARYKQVFFFAAGIGITPIYALIKELLYAHANIQVILFYSSRHIDDTVFYEELKTLQHQFAERFHLELLFSSALDLTRARLHKLLLPVLLEQHASAAKEERLFYTCGPFPYMRMVIYALEEQGYSSDQIRKENFDTHTPAPKKLPPDTNAHEVIIRLRNHNHGFVAQYPDTILQAAKKNGILLPYSCETGRCGSCAMLCTKGKVWISYNEVLTEKDIAEGKILTCVGYAIAGNVKLEG